MPLLMAGLNIIANASGGSFDVAPVSDHASTKVDLKVHVLVGEVLDLGHDDVTLAMELKVFVLPGADCVMSDVERQKSRETRANEYEE
jgi:hypothetical protein